jgi:hypothetical protein
MSRQIYFNCTENFGQLFWGEAQQRRAERWGWGRVEAQQRGAERWGEEEARSRWEQKDGGEDGGTLQRGAERWRGGGRHVAEGSRKMGGTVEAHSKGELKYEWHIQSERGAEI